MAVYALTPDQIEAQKAQSAQPGQTIGTAAPSGQGPAGSPMAKQQASNLATQQQGSGRFTNIQKYLQANQAGGKNIASQVGQNLNKDYGQQSEQAQKYYSQLGQNIAGAQQVAQQGAGYQQQLKDIGSQIGQAQQAGFDQRAAQAQTLGGIEQFVNQPDFQRFQDIQAGRGIDESLLSLQQQRAAQAANQTAQGTLEAQRALGSEGGRFNLLRKTLGVNPGYTTGQQRLDQVLLGQGGGLGSVQAQTAQQAREAMQQAKLAGSKLSDVNRLRAQEQGLMGDINTQAGANEKAYMDMLTGFVDPLNAQRDQEFSGAEAKFMALRNQLNSPVNEVNNLPTSGDTVASQKLTPTAAPLTPEQQFSSEELARLGVTGPTRAYNVFKGLEGFQDVASKGASAMSAQDVADMQDVARYQALAKIMGKDPAQQQLTKASELGAAWSGKEGESGLGARLAQAQTDFTKTATDTKMRGMANWGTPQYWAEQDALRKQEALRQTQPTDSDQSFTSGMAESIINHPLNLVNQIPQVGSGFRSGGNNSGTNIAQTNQLAALALLNQGKEPIVGRMSGSAADVGTLWRDRSEQDLWNQFSDFLKNQGYQNTIGGEVAAPNQDVANIFNQGYTKP
jgi:hypothetical protein